MFLLGYIITVLISYFVLRFAMRKLTNAVRFISLVIVAAAQTLARVAVFAAIITTIIWIVF